MQTYGRFLNYIQYDTASDEQSPTCPSTAKQLALLLLCGLCGAGGQFAITAAYSFAPAREISVYDYFQVIFGAVFGFFLFDQLPDLYSFLGYAVIILMAVVNFIYHNRRYHPPAGLSE